MNRKIRRCVIYTRKSVYEAEDNQYTSLDAQRDVCMSYINSQKSEGWMALSCQYDDNGYSGANIERPALSHLLEDVKAGKIDIIVIYKIDRLTRSLFDFARIIQILDQHNVSFVSVTQPFNTMTSVGRLTINVLLSFAQFERELIGERFRDKIAESRKNGFWTGATPPLGYNIVKGCLVINQAEAETIKVIFEKYIELKNIRLVKDYLDEKKVKGKATGHGRTKEGKYLGQGGLRSILHNPIHAGKISHRGQIYEGKHQAIINQETWNRTQLLLKDRYRKKCESKYSSKCSLRTKILSFTGSTYRFTHSILNGRVYLYYLCHEFRSSKDHENYTIGRFPAIELDRMVNKALLNIISNYKKVMEIINASDEQLLQAIIEQKKLKIFREPGTILSKIVIYPDRFELHISRLAILDNLSTKIRETCPIPAEDIYIEQFPFCISKSGRKRLINLTDTFSQQITGVNSEKLRNLIRGITWREDYFNGISVREIAEREKISTTSVSRFIRKSLDIAYVREINF